MKITFTGIYVFRGGLRRSSRKIKLNLPVAQERHELARGNGTITGCVRATNV